MLQKEIIFGKKAEIFKRSFKNQSDIKDSNFSRLERSI